MLTQRTFSRKTKCGNVLKVVREHYLREDIWCGSKLCEKCRHETKDMILDSNPKSLTNLYRIPHYVLLDTSAVLNQIDVFAEDGFANVIILQTVLDEIKHKSSSVYKRLLDIIANPLRKFRIFVNEHHKDAFIHRQKGESVNDRNDRAIRNATAWYEKHLKTKGGSIRVVLISDDKENRQKATEMKLLSCTVSEYVKGMEDQWPTLSDRLALDSTQFDENDVLSKKDSLYPAHLTMTQIQEGIKSRQLIQGKFQASRENYLEGEVATEIEDDEKKTMSVLVQGRTGLNRAVDGDIVVVQLLPESEWSAPSELVLQDEDGDPGDVLEEDVIKKNRSEQEVERRPTGHIVGIIRRKWRQYCGILQLSPVSGALRHIFVPAERKIPKIRIETRQADKLQRHRIIVAVDSWPRWSRYPQGHFVRALGPVGEKATENEVILLEHDIPHSKFSEAVLECLPEMPWSVSEEQLSKREDLRHIPVCSVDPPGCTDIDDALHCLKLDEKHVQVGVHIADVTHFIRPGTAIDREAASRATTVYLVDNRIDMVPELLSSNLCSLRGGEERYAFSVVWKMRLADATIVDTHFCKSVIRSRAALTYEEAQIRIDDNTQQDVLAKSLRLLNQLAKILKKRRIDNGALVLASPEIRFHVDSETLEPLEVVAKKIRDTNSMVEEFMLLANISVAKKILNEIPECAILRRHPTPPEQNFEPLIKAARKLGFTMDISSNKALANSLDEAVRPDNTYFNTMLRILATRCMLQAVYFVSGLMTADDFAHYGLAVPIYTHFTSPIRRYADVMVHRLLASCIGADSTCSEMLDVNHNSRITNNLNYRNRMAQYAGRASVALHTHLFFRDKIQNEQGYILYIRKNALQILIPKYGLEGTLYLATKDAKPIGDGNILFIYNEEEQTQSYEETTFHIFDPVTVQLSLDRSNIQHEKIVLQLVYPVIPGFSVPSQESENQEDVEMKDVSATAKDSSSDKQTMDTSLTSSGKKKSKKRKR